MSFFLIRNFTYNTVLVIVSSLLLLVNSEEGCDTNLENALTTLISSNEPATLQLQALRNDLIRKIKEVIQREELENELLQYKRSLSSLAHWNNMPSKRNLESLARAGYIRTLPLENDSNFKRNIPENSQTYLNSNNRHTSSYFDDSDLYKRNIASLAKSGMKVYGKRNVASLLRQDRYLNGMRTGRDENQTEKPLENYNEKRNIASIKAQFKPKFKRSVDESTTKWDIDYYDAINDEYPSPIYQAPFDYEEAKDMIDDYSLGKRFLGSVKTSAWLHQPSRFVPPNKRHIGAIARLGWLPSLRTVRRFNRSGRSTNLCDSRSVTANGQIDNNSISKSTLLLKDNCFIIEPARNKIRCLKALMSLRPE